ncbi:MAG: hypothetical protein ACSHYF_16455 [Verrucomicrobiaceae bacterium]
MKTLIILILASFAALPASAARVNLNNLNKYECGEVATALGIDLEKLVGNCLAPSKSPYATQQDAWSLLIWFSTHANLDGAAGESYYLLTRNIADRLKTDPDTILAFTKSLSKEDLANFPFTLTKFIEFNKMSPVEQDKLTKDAPILVKRLKAEYERP